ncbi:MAG: hypothetical protein VW874_09030 [Gammaproteobacteria bacterium]
MLLVLAFSTTFALAEKKTKIIDDKNEQRREGLSDNMNRVVFVDHDLNRTILNEKKGTKKKTVKVSLQKAGARRTPTNSLEVYSVFKNHTDYDLQVQARATFFDSDEIPLNDTTAWKRMYIPANSFGTYRDFSISPMASYFIVEVREGK